MRILQLCLKPPLPAVDGGCLAMQSVAEGLLEAGHEVRILTLFTAKHPFIREAIPAAFQAATQLEGIFADTRVRPAALLIGLLRRGSYNLRRFDVPAFHARLAALLKAEKFDAVHLESLFLTPYSATIRAHTQAPIVLRAHNVEFRLWQRRAAAAPAGLKRLVLRRIARQLKHDETQACAAVNGIAAITEEDATVFRALTDERIPVLHLPYALPLPQPDPKLYAIPLTLGHIGAMDWAPTAEGVRWLIDNVWPLIRAEQAYARLLLAGRHLQENDPSWQAPGVQTLGEVENAFQFMQSVAVVAVPPQTGGGMRIKLAEALALGCPVVSTTLGAEGIPVIEGHHLLLADDPKAFAAAVLRLFAHPETAAHLGTQARQLAATELNRARATEKLSDFYARLIATLAS